MESRVRDPHFAIQFAQRCWDFGLGGGLGADDGEEQFYKGDWPQKAADMREEVPPSAHTQSSHRT